MHGTANNSVIAIPIIRGRSDCEPLEIPIPLLETMWEWDERDDKRSRKVLREIMKETRYEFEKYRPYNPSLPAAEIVRRVLPDAVRWGKQTIETQERIEREAAQEKARRDALTAAERAAEDAERERLSDEFWSRVHWYGDTEETAASLPARKVKFVGFRDDAEFDIPEQDREFDTDWFRERHGQVFRLCTAFEREVEAADIEPRVGYTALRISRFGPDDPIPLVRELEVREADIERINSAKEEELAALFDYDLGATAFIKPGRCVHYYNTDFDLRGEGSPLSIVKNPPRKIELGRPASVFFNDCSELLNLSEDTVKDLPRTPWLIPGELLAGYVTGLIAPGGSGKSARSLQMAVAMGRGEGAAMGYAVAKRIKVWVINREDDPNQQRKRVAAICKLFGYGMRGLQGWVHLLNSDLTGTCLAKRGRNGERVEGPDVGAVVQYILDNDIGAVILDPLIGVHGLDENNNDDMRFLFDVLKRIAKLTGAAIFDIHHSNKPNGASSEGRAGNANSSRGASDIINAQRAARTMYNMAQSEAKERGVQPENAHRYVRIDDAKANHSAQSGKPQWFEKVTVRIDNGEDSFALRPVRLGNEDHRVACENLIARLLTAAIGTASDAAGKPINFSPSAKARGTSNTALWLQRNGAGEFSVEEIRAALAVITGLVIKIETYKNGGKTHPRYVLV